MKTNILRIFAVLVLVLCGVARSRAQGTAFTYQGNLTTGGAAANGAFDFTFTLFPTNSGGSAVSSTVTNSSVGVTNGLFTTTIDFSNAFNGALVWLEIGVRSAGGASNFVTLSPRQQVTPSPYAITAANLSGGGSGLTNLPSQNGFLFAYLITSGSGTSVRAGANVTFSNTGSINGWINSGSAVFTCLATGTYLVQYTARLQTGAPLGIVRNGAVVDGSVCPIASAAAQNLVVALNETDTLSLQNTGTNSLTLVNGGNATSAAATLTITRLN